MAIASKHETGIPESLASAQAVNYLGDSETVETIVRQFFARNYARSNPNDPSFLPKEQWGQMAQADCLDMATIFLGRNKDYPGLKTWNEAGGIDAWLRVEANVGEEDPQLCVATYFQHVLTEFNKIANYAQEEGVLPEQWQWQIDDLVESTRDLLLGMPAEPDEET